MLFVESRYLVFFAALFCLHWLLRSNTHRKLLLLAGSYFFYAAWDYRFLSLILISTVVDYVVALRIHQSNDPGVRRNWVTLSLVVNLGILGFFKYFNFFSDSLVGLLYGLGIELSYTELNIILPVGISFYTFQTLSYTIDVYRGTLEPRRQILDVALFVAFFPQLVAGPIVRARQFLPQLDVVHKLRDVNVRFCVTLFLIGFIKKAVVSDNVAPWVDLVFADPASYSDWSIRGAVGLYAVQIYCDFSGYSDMAIASAAALGFRLPLNFNTPYLAASITDFWRRWHISLSSWLRDYLYISLGGNRGTALLTYRNLMLTMLLGGLWHGAAWNFVIWGGLHGLALMVHRRFRRPSDHENQRSFVNWCWTLPLTLFWVCLCWVFFRAVTFPDAYEMLLGLAGLRSSPGELEIPAWSILVLPLMMLVQHLKQKYELTDRLAVMPAYGYTVIVALAVAFSITLMPIAYRPFIYFQF